MENDILRNKIAPWQEKGRWYKFTLLSDGSTISIDRDTSDVKTATISASGNISPGFKYISDFKARIDDTSPASNTNIAAIAQIRVISDGLTAIHIGIAAAYFNKLTLWVFGDLS